MKSSLLYSPPFIPYFTCVIIKLKNVKKNCALVCFSVKESEFFETFDCKVAVEKSRKITKWRPFSLKAKKGQWNVKMQLICFSLLQCNCLLVLNIFHAWNSWNLDLFKNRIMQKPSSTFLFVLFLVVERDRNKKVSSR